MNDFIAQLCAHFEATPPAQSHEAILHAMVLVERHSGSRPDVSISTEAASVPFVAHEIERLLVALARFNEQCPAHPDAASAIFALGKSNDSRFEPLYRRVLSCKEIYSEFALRQAQIALENLGAGE